MHEVRIVVPRLHEAQKQVNREAKRYNILACGRRWGKTKKGTRRLIKVALQGWPVAWGAPNYKYFEEIWREVEWRLRPALSPRDINKTERQIRLPTGGLIDFWTMDGDGPARGRKYKEFHLDEAAFIRDLIDKWQRAIRPTLTDLAGGAWFYSTPDGMNDFYDLWQAAENDPEWAQWQRPSSENPYLPPEEIEAAKRELPSIVFAQEYEAQFVSASGGRVKRSWLKYGRPAEPLPTYMGADLAISTSDGADYTAVVVVAKDNEGRVFVLDAQRIREPFHGVMQFIEAMAAKWKPSLILVEDVAYQAAVKTELLRNTSLPVRGVNPRHWGRKSDKASRFLALEARYEQGLVYHDPELPRSFENEILSFPVGDHDDQVDALVYAYEAMSGASDGELSTMLGW